MDLQLTDRVALVTAASRGLGRACAIALAAEGMRVAIASRDIEALNGLAKEIDAGPGQALPIELDLTQDGSVEAAVSTVLQTWGAVHVVVANAPGPPAGSVESITTDQWRAALDVNVIAMVRLTKAVLPVMRAQKDGRLHYIATIGVRTAQENMVLSNSTRLAILGLAKTLSLEVAADNVLVNVIAPGPIATDRMAELFAATAEQQNLSEEEARARWLDEVPVRRMGDPDDLATMVTLLSSPRCSFTTGAVIPIDGGKARGY